MTAATGLAMTACSRCRTKLAIVFRARAHDADWADDGMASVAAELQGMTWDGVYDYMRENIYRAVMAHEVGHTIGLRHALVVLDAFLYRRFLGTLGSDTKSIKYRNGDGTPAGRSDARPSWITMLVSAESFEGISPYDNAAIRGYGMLLRRSTTGILLWVTGASSSEPLQ